MPFGVYLHVPFCGRRCDYCAFATWDDRSHLKAAYAAACATEAKLAALVPADSVFVGGGTPSQMPAELLASVMREIPIRPGAEVTAECNPDDASAELFSAWRQMGVNRVSFGVQSMSASVLAALGRTHDVESVGRAVELARHAGFNTFGVDLIYGTRGETIDDWGETLDTVLALDPPHVSAYALTPERGTPLGDDPRRRPDEDDQAAKYELADEKLAVAGLAWYEISNWSRPGHECRHNRLYWEAADYRGIGCAAHSHSAGHRWWNHRTPERYIAAIETGSSPISGEERLDADARRLEARQLALRTSSGVEVDALPDDRLLDGLVKRFADRMVLTRAGRMLANEVAYRLR